MNRSRKCLAVVLLLATGACGLFSSPTRTLMQYFDAMRKGKWDAAYGLLSNQDRGFQSLEAYRAGLADNPLAVGLLQKTTYKVKQSAQTGNTATVVVAVTAPDVSGMIGTLMASAMASAFSGSKPDSKDAAAELAKKMAGGDLPMATRDETFTLVNENGGWRVYLGLEPKARLAEAKDLLEHKKYAEAKVKYEAALALDPKAAEAASGLKTVTTALERLREQEAYFPRIEIRNLRVKRGSSFMESYALLEGEIKNTGERILNRLEISVACLDKDGKPVSETSDLVFSVPKEGEATFISAINQEFAQPLKPNYSRRILVNLEKAPSEWSGKVTVRVAALEFDQ